METKNFVRCTYCDFKPGSIESDHFRPKGPHPQTKRGRLHPEWWHQGYLWLGSEKTNRLPLCRDCNNFKGTKFPIEGKRVTKPPSDKTEWTVDSETLLAERPLLLHPKFHKFQEHVTYAPNGKIKSINKSKVAKTTMVTVKLNRFPLKFSRKKIIDKYRNRFRKQLKIFSKMLSKKFERKKRNIDSEEFSDDLELAFRTLVEELTESVKDPKKDYPMMRKQMLEDFEHFIIDHFENDQHKKILRKAYKRFTSSI